MPNSQSSAYLPGSKPRKFPFFGGERASLRSMNAWLREQFNCLQDGLNQAKEELNREQTRRVDMESRLVQLENVLSDIDCIRAYLAQLAPNLRPDPKSGGWRRRLRDEGSIREEYFLIVRNGSPKLIDPVTISAQTSGDTVRGYSLDVLIGDGNLCVPAFVDKDAGLPTDDTQRRLRKAISPLACTS